jgi:UDP-glucose 4-epimerase
MKVLVTGGAGFIGSHIVDRCLSAGHEVVVVDDLSTGCRQAVHPDARLSVMDIRSPDLAAVFRAERPEVVIHHAARAEVRRSVEGPLLDAEVNILGALNLLECGRRFGVTRVIYASSGGAVYGDTDVLPTPEDHPARPASPCGVSKLAVECYLACRAGLYGIRSLIFRYANVYGPRQSPLGEAGVVAIFSHRLLHGQPVVINGDGSQTRDYVYVEDVAEANVIALEHPDATGVVNIGTGVETSVVELFERLCVAVDMPVMARQAPANLGEQCRSVLDVTRAQRLLGWKPRVTLAEGLSRTVEHLSSRMAGAAASRGGGE